MKILKELRLKNFDFDHGVIEVKPYSWGNGIVAEMGPIRVRLYLLPDCS